MRVQSFKPRVSSQSRVLILGTMPGVASLQAQQYYAHPRNQFWPLMGGLIGAGLQLPYAQRIERFLAAGFALWDVLQQCQRPGSLDSEIKRESEIPNRISQLLRKYPDIHLVAFNGGHAERLFRRHLFAQVMQQRTDLQLLRLPSTSPAHAARNYAQKLREWRRLKEHL